MDYAVIVLFWAGYCFLHSFLISITVADAMSRMLKEYYAFYRIAYVLISLALLVPLIRFTEHIEQTIIITYVFPWSLIRTVLTAGSILMFAWSFFFDYDALSFFGIRQIMNFRRPEKSGQPGALRKNGLLGIVRHPMYFTLIVYLWCQTTRVVDVVVNIVLTVYVIVGTRLEERKLVREFGESYLSYQHQVPMLIPFAHVQ
jgi:methanethiol S-methyltransferase